MSSLARIFLTPLPPRVTLCYHRHRLLARLTSNSPPYARPGPPPLPSAQQREWEELIRRSQAPPASVSPTDDEEAAQLQLHPDARRPIQPDFEGDTNLATGEIGGPKKEPLRWGATGEWTYGGRATDF
ncbi:hypothetical protein JB92DRAFT_2923169 [Gautieria morchelliformis]|nr:hypothetical protein JB92DRAFT_2923169 [Gautieria morchelliformis]